MANADSTLRNETNSRDERYMAEEYPQSGDSFAVFYSVGTGLKWAINDEEGMAIAEAANYEDAVKISNAFRAGAYRDAVKAAHELSMDIPNDKATEYRAGAMACLEAMRIIKLIAAGGKSKATVLQTMNDWWNMQNAAVTSMHHAAGKHGEFMAGFVAVFAEYVCEIFAGGVPVFHAWKPESTMTNKEKTNHRAELTRQVEEGEKITA